MIAPAATCEGRFLANGPDSEPDSPSRAARHLLCSSGYSLLQKLHCQVRDGVVTIWGRVPSFFLKQMAQEAVLKLAQVREVKNLVEVCPYQPTDRDLDWQSGPPG